MVETEEVDFADLRVGDVVFSEGQQKTGTISRIIPEFSEVVFEEGPTVPLVSPVKIRKRR